jgi:hypothetical protein
MEWDWNNEFIKYLKSIGYVGTSDELIIQKWLMDLYKDVSGKLDDNNNVPGDFV